MTALELQCAARKNLRQVSSTERIAVAEGGKDCLLIDLIRNSDRYCIKDYLEGAGDCSNKRITECLDLLEIREIMNVRTARCLGNSRSGMCSFEGGSNPYMFNHRQ